MIKDRLINIIHDGEGIQTEFKSASFSLPRDTFETITAFLNRSGGHLLLGVENNGSISGVIEDSVGEILQNLANSCNDPNKLFPTFYLSTEVIKIEDKTVIYVYVPESSQVHRTANRIFDRNSDGDFDITNNPALVSQIYMRKQSTYSENDIYPYMTMEHFESSLFDKSRILAKNQRSDHPWQAMSNEELLKSASLWKSDLQSGREGYTLAAAVLFGKETTVASVLPAYKTDAILRVENLDRYDDRDDIRCNLITAYSRLMSFIQKHLPDRFYLEGTQRVSLRDKIFREIVTNLLIHREFTNASPARLIIEADRVVTENANKPHGIGEIDPANFSPHPKNPTIAHFFKEIGYADELGSGIRITNRLIPIYSGKNHAQFIEGDIFKTIIPIKFPIKKVENAITFGSDVSIEIIDPIADAVNDGLIDGVNDGLIDGVSDGVKKSIVEAVRFIEVTPGKNAKEIGEKIRKSKPTVERYLNILKKIDLVEFRGSAKAGGYHITKKMEEKLQHD